MTKSESVIADRLIDSLVDAKFYLSMGCLSHEHTMMTLRVVVEIEAKLSEMGLKPISIH